MLIIKKLLILVCLSTVLCSTAAFAVTINYGNFTLSPPSSQTSWSDSWNLMNGDMTLSYSIDMSQITQSQAWLTSSIEVGIRQAGSSNFNPGPLNTYQGGAGGWMASRVGDLTPSPGILSLHDKHSLQASGGRDEGDYDAASPDIIGNPIRSFDGNHNGWGNYGIWFDRDGVGIYQAQLWGIINGSTYNTGGVYQIVINYHAINEGLGTMFSTINGIQTGFYTDGWKNNQPEFYPAGLSFKGDMSNMQVFAGMQAPEGVNGDVLLRDITVTGSPTILDNSPSVPEPATVLLGLLGLGSVAGFIRFRRR